MGTWIHWVVWNIPPKGEIGENSVLGTEGMNDFRKRSYGGPCWEDVEEKLMDWLEGLWRGERRFTESGDSGSSRAGIKVKGRGWGLGAFLATLGLRVGCRDLADRSIKRG